MVEIIDAKTAKKNYTHPSNVIKTTTKEAKKNPNTHV